MQFLALSLVPLAAFVILIILIAKTTGNSTRIGTLEWELKRLHALERKVNEMSVYIDALVKRIQELETHPGRKKEVAQEIVERHPDETIKASSKSMVSAVEIEQPEVAPLPPAVPSRTREEWEALIGGKLLNRIGALALIIGIGFFLKYAFDNNWLTELMRVLLGGVIGAVCLAGGYRTNKRGFEIFAQGMVGAGIAILYLSVFAAFNFYHLMPQWVAFVFMSIVTLIAFLSGLYYNSLAESILGWAGGFLTPVLLSTGQANEAGLFTYIALLDAGLLAMVIRKERWAILEPLAFLGTWLMYIVWWEQYYGSDSLWVTIFFVTIFWLLFLVPDMVRSGKSAVEEKFIQLVPICNAFFYFLALYFLIDPDYHAWMGIVTVLIGAVYLSIFLQQRRRGHSQPDAAIRHTLTAATMLVMATAIQFSGLDTVLFWSIEAAGLFYLGSERKEAHIENVALLLFGLAGFKLLFLTDNALSYAPIREFTLLFNHRALTFAVLAASLGFGAFRSDSVDGPGARRTANALHSAWCVVLFLLLSAEVVDFFRFRMLDQPDILRSRLAFFRQLTFGVVWISASLPIVWVGLKKRIAPLVGGGLVFAALAFVAGVVRGIAFDPIEAYSPFFNVRSIVLVLLATGLLLQAQFIQKRPEEFPWLRRILGYVQLAVVLVIFVLLTGETRDFFRLKIAQADQAFGALSLEASHLANLQQMLLSGVWLLYSVVLLSIGIWRKYGGMRFVAIGLFGVTILKIFIYDLSFLETLYRFLSFIALGVILIGVSYAYQKYKDVIGGKA